ncbi:MAG: SMC-Scp complex subunit ScpB [Actinomycetota bacterium]|jgi:segregation and condensation protein B
MMNSDVSVEGAAAAADSNVKGLGGLELNVALEALLLVADEPVSSAHLADFLDVDETQVVQALNSVADQYRHEGRGFELRGTADGWRLYTAASCSDLMLRWSRDGQRSKLTPAALETLAVIAYKQPITRGRIASIRGVNVDGVVRTLMARGLIAEAGTDPTSQAVLYVTTALFLERLGIHSLEDLPAISPLLPDVQDAVDLFDSLGAQ